MPRLLRALTWNVRGQVDAVRLALRYAASQPASLLCLQELPEVWDAAWLRSETKGRLAAPPTGRDRRIAFVSTPDVVWHGDPAVFISDNIKGASERMVGARISAPSFRDVQIVGVHFPDRRQLPAGHARERVVGELAREIHLFWDDGPLILLGDFNANPFHPELAERRFLWAIRDRGDLEQGHPLVTQRLRVDHPVLSGGQRYGSLEEMQRGLGLRPRKPLFNPMWRWLSEQTKHPRGTFHYDGEDTIVPWNCLDHVIVSSHFVERLRVRILTQIGGKQLIDAGRKSIRSRYGDHLPVEAVFGGDHGEQ
jgi:Endonuclease/Exonuclease/phosphatase family